MACGSGKSLVAVHSAEKISNRIFVTEPSLALVQQMLTNWRANTSFKNLDVLVVCSDETIVDLNADKPKISRADLSARVTSNPTEIAEFLRDTSLPKLLISTLHSSPLVSEAMGHPNVKPFGITVVDEAHRTATAMGSDFALVLEKEAIPSRTRLFMTATPKIYDMAEDAEVVYSMDDSKVFGPRSYTLGFREAIKRGLLTDYQLIIAAVSEAEFKQYRRQFKTDENFRDGVSQVAFCRAIAASGTRKAMTFLKTVARARDFASNLKNAWAKFGDKAVNLWSEFVSGSMPTHLRHSLTGLFGDQSTKTLAVLSNCRCLGEGVDIPTLDCVAFIDKKNSEIDVIQAVGRAMRLSPTKTIGTIFVPVVIPDGAELDDVTNSTEFKKVLQVIRALRSVDDGFEVRLTRLAERSSSSGGTGGPVDPDITKLDLDSLPAGLRDGLRAKIVSRGLGIIGTPLSVEAIQKAALAFREERGYWPTAATKEPVPGMPNETWNRINWACYAGGRNLHCGVPLADIIHPLRVSRGEISSHKKGPLDLELIKKAILRFRDDTGTWPTANTEMPVPGMADETWSGIDSAGQIGIRNIPKGMTLAEVTHPLRLARGEVSCGKTEPLDLALIKKAILQFREENGCWPSRGTKEPVPGMPNETWIKIDVAGRSGGRNLPKGMTLADLTHPFRLARGEVSSAKKGSLDLERVKKAILLFRKKNGAWPTANTKEPVPGMPNETWKGVNKAGYAGKRLPKGMTLKNIKNLLKKQ